MNLVDKNKLDILFSINLLMFISLSLGHDVNGNENTAREGANKRGNSSRLTQSFHFFMFEPIFSPVNALNQPI
ncbi:hypothetical protein ACS8A1_05055, partial [Yersinia enterocolitica]|uniref:hypothetical protein n=1 Tax=Yersinia enterocolitica TaxID=630 RepID=UPI003F46AFC8